MITGMRSQCLGTSTLLCRTPELLLTWKLAIWSSQDGGLFSRAYHWPVGPLEDPCRPCFPTTSKDRFARGAGLPECLTA